MPRKKGSLGKDKTRALRALQQMYPEYDPLTELARLANCSDTTNTEKITCNKEIAQYVYPKLKAVEHSGETDHNVTIKWK